jgi:hypothetical protein
MASLALLRRRAMGTVRTVHQRRAMGYVPSWATVDPWAMSAATPAVGKNLVGGVWSSAAKQSTVIDPLNGEGFVKVPDTSIAEIGPYVERMAGCPRSGLHNPLKNPERYTMLGEVMAIAREIASKAPLAVYGTKRMINYARDHSTADGLDYIGIWNASMLQKQEIQEAIKANAEKRAGAFVELPVLKGRGG